MKSLINIIISFVVFVIAIAIANASGSSLVLQAVFIAFSIQWIAFIPAYIFQTEKFYDLMGSITYLTVIWFTLMSSSNESTLANIGNIVIVLLISSWAIRLGTFLFLRIKKDGEDKRFRTIKPSASRFFMTWTLQGLWVSLCSMCALTAISSESGIILNVFFYLGVAIFILGFVIEIIADNQKSKFRSIEANKDSFITTGLWAKSRHPNYLGEILLWLGVAVISFSSLSGWQYLTLISPIFTYLLLVYVSGVRMLEEIGEKKWGHNEEYIKYKSTTPRLFFNLK
jgi:steroid 5-alpha reductase family enzyme